MLEAALASTKALANSEAPITGGDSPVYFDLFGRVMVVAKQSTFFDINLVLLIAGPALVLGRLLIHWFRGELYRITTGWLRLPVALTISTLATLGFGQIVVATNPFVCATFSWQAYLLTYSQIVYSSWPAVLTSILAVAYVSLYLPLVLAQSWNPVHHPKSMALLQVYTLSWLMLVWYETLLKGSGSSWLFLATLFNASSLIAVLLDLGQSFYVPHARAIEHREDDPEAEEIEQDTEITPLLRDDVPGVPAEKGTGEDNQSWVLYNLTQSTVALTLSSTSVRSGSLSFCCSYTLTE